MERTPSLRHLADVRKPVEQFWDGNFLLECHKDAQACKGTVLVLEGVATTEECADWVFGVRWTPEQFLKQAVYVGHPFSNFSGLPAEVSAACADIAAMSRVDIVSNRCSKLGEWVRLAKTLQPEELMQKERMPAERRRILEGKKLLLMKHIIDAEGYDDRTLVDDVSNGFALVGEVPKSNVLPRKLIPAAISEQELHATAHKANLALRYMTRSSGDLELDQKLWTKTVSEVDKGWMLGPLTWDVLGSGDTVSRRFPWSRGVR